MQITMQRTRPAWPAKTKLRMTLDCSRIAKKNVMMSGLFVEGGRQTLLYSCKKNKKDQMFRSDGHRANHYRFTTGAIEFIEAYISIYFNLDEFPKSTSSSTEGHFKCRLRDSAIIPSRSH